MKFETTEKPMPHPPGPAKLFLKAFNLTEQPSFNDKSKMETRGVWEFISNKRDASDRPCKHSVWTGLRYGNPRAGLTKFANMLMPNLVDPAYLKAKGYAKPEDCFNAEFDSDLFVNKRFDAQFTNEYDESGNLKSTLVFIAPEAVAGPAAAANAPQQEELDPFADDHPGNQDNPFAGE